MPRTSSLLASAAVVFFAVGMSAVAVAQSLGGAERRVGRAASYSAGSIAGVVLDEAGNPVSGALVSSLGPSSSFTVTDAYGRFEIKTLAPGPYVINASLAGYVALRAAVVQVRPNTRVPSSISLRRAGASPRVLTAGIGALPGVDAGASVDDSTQAGSAEAAPPLATDARDDGETAWRIRHLRRGILKDATIPSEWLAEADPPASAGPFTPVDFLGRAAESSARLATSFFTTTPFSGQVNLLTAGSFDAPTDLFSNGLQRGSIANVMLTAPVGSQADWTVRGAFTQADISAWIVAGSYKTRAPALHSYDLGLSYATERYAGDNALAVQDMTIDGRTVGDVYGFDTYAVNPTLSVTYGARYARYDYLEHRGLFSPRLEVGLTPGANLRFNAMVSRSAVAPGAEEFVSPAQAGIWLPPQRTFSSLEAGAPLEAELVTQMALEAERDFGRSTVSLEVFRQHITDQLVTFFGVDMPGQSSSPQGHYWVANGGDGQAMGYRAGYRAVFSGWMKGSLEYTNARGDLTPGDGARYLVLMAPSVIQSRSDRVQDVTTSIETHVPETSTRLLVVFRVSNAFAGAQAAGQAADDNSLDSRFDVQVRQSLPFMDFANARWEMLVAVRNFFHEAAVDQSLYDELLVVRPPKRIVGGLTMRF